MGEVAFSLAKMTEGADVSATANISITFVGATLAQRQPFWATPISPNRGITHVSALFHVVYDVELTAARAVTTLKNKRFNPFKASPVQKTGEVAFSLAKMTEGADVSDFTNLSLTP